MEWSGLGGMALWAAFVSFVVAMLAFSLSVLRRKAHPATVRESIVWSSVWIVPALLFNLFVWRRSGSDPGLAHTAPR